MFSLCMSVKDFFLHNVLYTWTNIGVHESINTNNQLIYRERE